MPVSFQALRQRAGCFKKEGSSVNYTSAIGGTRKPPPASSISPPTAIAVHLEAPRVDVRRVVMRDRRNRGGQIRTS